MLGGVLLALGIVSVIYSLSFKFKSGGLVQRLLLVSGRRMEEEKTFATKLGQRFGFLGRYLNIGEEIELIKLAGSNWTKETIYGLMVLTAIGGAALGFLSFGAMGFLVGLVSGPFVLLQVIQGKANRVRRQMRRELADIMNMMAVELAAGANVTQAIESAASSPAMVGRFLQLVLKKSASGNLLGIGGGKGKLVEESEKLGMQELVSLARQLEEINAMGIGGAEILSNLAREAARRYLSDVQARVAKLESELAVPSVLFFFLPFVFLLLALTGISLVSSGIFGG
ncbi:MAG: hypothetical protein QW687_00460 [Candidatus Hadarchaeales archaeon]